MTKKVLITGANGLLGANLTRELFRVGYEIKILVRPTADLSAISDIPCEIFFGNIDNKEQVVKAVEGCHIVIHNASITEQWGVPYETYERINFTGTKNMVDAGLHHKIEKFIYVSTAATIGPGSRETPGSELNGFTMAHSNSGYILTKYLAQQYVLEQVAAKQLPGIVVNPTFMIGPYDSKPSSGKLLLYGLRKKVLFYPPGGKNFVHIQDVCKGILQSIHFGKHGDCYLLAGHNLSYREFFRLVHKAAHTSAIMVRIPPLFLKLSGVVGSLLGKITGKTGKLNYTAASLLCIGSYYSGKKSEREFSMQYKPVEEAISASLDWFRENNYF